MEIKSIILSVLGTLGFAITLNISKKKIPYILLGALLSSGIYEVLITKNSVFFSVFLATISIEVFSEIIARISKTPAIVILLPSTIPLLPGGALFRAMYSLLNQEYNSFLLYTKETIITAFAISMGAITMYIILNIIRYTKQYFTTKP